MPRSTEEWIGASADADPPPRVKRRIVLRAGGRCHDCFRQFDEKLAPEFDHRPALILGGENRESHIFAVCKECHKRKSRIDLKAKSLTAKLLNKRYKLDNKRSKFRNARDGPFKTTFYRGTVERTDD